MDYKLAKKLHDAGFPQKHKDGTAERYAYTTLLVGDKEAYYIPTLEELIDACGDMQLFRRNGAFMAVKEIYDNKTYKIAERARNPKEAVAKLWLALNK